MLHFDPNPISIRHLAATIWTIFEVQKQYKTEEFVTSLRGCCTPNQNLARFMLYLKIINTFKKNDMSIL